MKFFVKDEPQVLIRKPKKKKGASELLQKQYVRTLKDMPELRTAIALKESGHLEEYNEFTDPVKAKRKEIDKIISDEAIALIKSDPSLRKELATLAAKNMLDSSSSDNKNGESLTPAGQLLESIRQLKELKDELKEEGDGNTSPGGWSSAVQQILTNPEVASVLASALKQIIVPGQQIVQRVVPQKNYVVMVEDKLTELTESQYTEMIKSGRIKPIGLLEQPKKEETKQEIKVTQEKETELPDWAKDFQFDELQSYLELSPEEFVEQLKTEADNESAPQLKMLWNFLTSSDFDSITKVLEPYKNNGKAGKFIQTLFEKREWVESVISIIKNEVK